MNRFKALALAGVLALAPVGVSTLAPAGTPVAPVAAQANHPSGAVKIWYTYHYDWRCQWNIRYGDEPFYKGYLYKVWYKTKHVDYSDFDTYWHGFRDYATTSFSHRQYSTTYPRCAGGAY